MTENRADTKLDRVFMDFSGPNVVPAIGENYYVVVLVDDYIRIKLLRFK